MYSCCEPPQPEPSAKDQMDIFDNLAFREYNVFEKTEEQKSLKQPILLL